MGSLSDYIDGTLDEALCNELERHLTECDDCQVVVNTLRKTVELYHKSSGTASIPEDVRQRLYACLDLKDYLVEKD
jgi:anti-sigma factor RsiW